MIKKTTFFELRAVGKHLKILKVIEIKWYEYFNILLKECLIYCTKLDFKHMHETQVFWFFRKVITMSVPVIDFLVESVGDYKGRHHQKAEWGKCGFHKKLKGCWLKYHLRFQDFEKTQELINFCFSVENNIRYCWIRMFLNRQSKQNYSKWKNDKKKPPKQKTTKIT